MGVNIVDALLSVILVVILLPKFGIEGYIITVYFTELINAALSITRLICISQARLNVINIIIKPLICVIASANIIKLMINKFPLPFSSSYLTLIFNISLTASLYITFLLFCRIKILKKSKKLLKYCK